jgi:hypothetical protein
MTVPLTVTLSEELESPLDEVLVELEHAALRAGRDSQVAKG